VAAKASPRRDLAARRQPGAGTARSRHGRPILLENDPLRWKRRADPARVDHYRLYRYLPTLPAGPIHDFGAALPPTAMTLAAVPRPGILPISLKQQDRWF
jgi:hypothetical protein